MNAVRIRSKIEDGVVTVVRIEDKGVGARASCYRVIAGTGADMVIAGTT